MVTLGELLSSSKTLKVAVGAGFVTVEYNPTVITALYVQEIQRDWAETQVTKLLSDVLVAWDLSIDEKAGVAKTTYEELLKVPSVILSAINDAINEDLSKMKKTR